MAQVHNLTALNDLPNVIKAVNPAGDYTLFVVDASPNGVVSAEPGDFAIVDEVGDADHGRWFRNVGTGATSTVWVPDSGDQVTVVSGAPASPPLDPSVAAIAYDVATGGVYLWDPVGAAWSAIGDLPPDWQLEGNAGTSPLSAGGPNFVGTTDAVGLSIGTDGEDRVNVSATGVVTVRPDGSTDRVTVTDTQTDIRHTNGGVSEQVSVGDNLFGLGAKGAGLWEENGATVGFAVVRDAGGGVTVAAMSALDAGFGVGGHIETIRDPGNDATSVLLRTDATTGQTTRLEMQTDGTAGTSSGRLVASSVLGLGGEYAFVQADYAGAGQPEGRIEAADSVDHRYVACTASEVEIRAGDKTANVPNGADGDILVRNGTGSQVRFDSVVNVVGNGYAETRVVAAAGIETVTHGLTVMASALGDFPVNVTIIDDGTGQVVIPDTIDFTVGTNAVDIGFAAAGTYNIYVSRMIG